MKGMLLMIQLGFSFMVFLFLAAVNWYQGSELISDRFDWNYTAKISKLLNGIDTITSPKQISQLDFFIYSAKHDPVMSMLMILSFLYVLAALFLLIYSVKFNKQKIHLDCDENTTHKFNGFPNS